MDGWTAANVPDLGQSWRVFAQNRVFEAVNVLNGQRKRLAREENQNVRGQKKPKARKKPKAQKKPKARPEALLRALEHESDDEVYLRELAREIMQDVTL